MSELMGPEAPVSFNDYPELKRLTQPRIMPFNPAIHANFYSAHPESNAYIQQALDQDRAKLRSDNTGNLSSSSVQLKFKVFAPTFHTQTLAEESLIDAVQKGNLDAAAGINKTRPELYFGAKFMIGQEVSRLSSGSRRELLDSEPDMRFPQPSNSQDRNVYMLLGIKLAQGKLIYRGKPVESTHELIDLSREVGKPINNRYLLYALDALQSKENFDKLLTSHAFKQEDLPDFCKNLAGLCTELALDISFEGREAELMLPYALDNMFERFEVSDPGANLLPFVSDSFLRYLAAIPDHIKPGQRVDMLKLNAMLTSLGNFNTRVIINFLRAETGGAVREPMKMFAELRQMNPELANNLNGINESLATSRKDFQSLFNYFKTNPSLINRFVAPPLGQNPIIDYREWKKTLLGEDSSGNKTK